MAEKKTSITKSKAKKPLASKSKKEAKPSKQQAVEEKPKAYSDEVPPRKGKRGPIPRRTRKEKNSSFASKVSPDAPLNPKMQLFVERYLIHLSPVQAAIEAGYSQSTAETKSGALMKQPAVAAAIKRAMDERAKRNNIDQDFVFNAVADIAKGNIGDYMTWQGRTVLLKSSEDIPHEMKALIQEISEGENGGYKIKLYDRMSALRLLMQHMGMLDRTRYAKTNVRGETASILNDLYEDKITPTQAALRFDMSGIPIPESVRLMVQREKEEPESQDDGQYATLTPEDMDKRDQERMAALKEEREKFVPERQAEVRQIKAELSQVKKDDTFSQKGGSGGKKV